MTQGETASGKCAGVRLLGLWRLKEDWGKHTEFPLLTTLKPVSQKVLRQGSNAVTAATPALLPGAALTGAGHTGAGISVNPSRDTGSSFSNDPWALRPWMSLRQSKTPTKDEDARTKQTKDSGRFLASNQRATQRANQRAHASAWGALELEHHFQHWLFAICDGCAAAPGRGGGGGGGGDEGTAASLSPNQTKVLPSQIKKVQTPALAPALETPPVAPTSRLAIAATAMVIEASSTKAAVEEKEETAVVALNSGALAGNLSTGWVT